MVGVGVVCLDGVDPSGEDKLSVPIFSFIFIDLPVFGFPFLVGRGLAGLLDQVSESGVGSKQEN